MIKGIWNFILLVTVVQVNRGNVYLKKYLILTFEKACEIIQKIMQCSNK